MLVRWEALVASDDRALVVACPRVVVDDVELGFPVCVVELGGQQYLEIAVAALRLAVLLFAPQRAVAQPELLREEHDRHDEPAPTDLWPIGASPPPPTTMMIPPAKRRPLRRRRTASIFFARVFVETARAFALVPVVTPLLLVSRRSKRHFQAGHAEGGLVGCHAKRRIAHMRLPEETGINLLLTILSGLGLLCLLRVRFRHCCSTSSSFGYRRGNCRETASPKICSILNASEADRATHV